SPVLYRKTVILQLDGLNRSSRLAAFNRKTGALEWERKRPTVGFSHSTPVLVRLGGKDTLLVAASNAVQGVSPSDGKELGWCAAAGDTASPVLGNGLVYCDSGRGGIGVCVEPGGSGDVTKTRRKWKLDRVPEGFSSPVVVGPLLMRLCNPGVLKGWKMASGEEGFTVRLQGVSTASSPVVSGGGRLYLASAGRSYVVKPGEKPEVLAVNELGDGSPASPAVANGRLYLRGRRYLWCVGQNSRKHSLSRAEHSSSDTPSPSGPR